MSRKKSTTKDEPKTKRKYKKRVKKAAKSISVKSLKTPNLSSNKGAIISGNWIIANPHKHFATLIDKAIKEKRALTKTNKLNKNKHKKLRYNFSGGKLKKAKKNERDKNIVNIYYT